MNLFAGLRSQIKSLRERLKALDTAKKNQKEVKEVVDALNALEERYAKERAKRDEKRKAREQAAPAEVEKEADSSTTLTTTSPAAPGAATSPTTTTTPAATPAATPDDQKVSCPLCGGMTFNDQAAYQQHMEFTHASDVMPTTPGQKEDKLVASVETEAAPNCAICGVTFKSFPEYQAHREDAHGQRDYKPMDPAKKQEVVKNVEKNLGPAIIGEQEGPQFKLDDVVKPIRGSESTGKVMRWDGKPSDLVFVAWDSGPLADRDGFGGYYPKDLELFQEEPVAVEADGEKGKPPHNPGPEHICPDCKDWHEKHADLKGNYAALLKDLKEEREIHYTQGNQKWVERLDQKIQDLEKAIGEKFPKEAACPTCGSVMKESGAENAKDLTIMDHTPPRANSGPDAGGKDSHDEFQDEWAMPAGIEMESAKGAPNSVFNAQTAPEVANRLKSEVQAPYVNAGVASLGGPEETAVMFTVSTEPKEEWSNGILENSRYGKFYLDNNGELECHSGSFNHYNEPRMNFRKRNVKNVDQLIQVLNSWVAQVQAAHAAAPKTSALSAPVTEPTKISVFKKEFLATPVNGQKKFAGYDISQNGKKLFNIASKDSQPMTKEQLEFCAQIELTRGLKQAKLVEKIAFLDEGTKVYVIATDKSGKRTKFASLDHAVRGWVPSSKIKLIALESQTVRHGEHSDKVLGQTATETLLDCVEGGPIWVNSTELLDANRPPATPESLNPEVVEPKSECSTCHGEGRPERGSCPECGIYSSEARDKESSKDCPDCHGTFAGKENEKCPTCGRFSVKEAAISCPYCGARIHDRNRTTCEECGKPQEKEALQTALPGTIPNQRGYLGNPPVAAPEEKKAGGCDQCDAAMINGVFCHETGCPKGRSRKCFNCGYSIPDECDGNCMSDVEGSTKQADRSLCTCGHNSQNHLHAPGKAKDTPDGCNDSDCSCDQYVAKQASLNKKATVTHREDGWHVLSEKGKNLGGPYKSKAEAVKRLRQVEYFKHQGSVRPFSKKLAAETMIDPYAALSTHIDDMRSRMTQVQDRLQSTPVVKAAGSDEKDNSKLDIPAVFEDLAQGIDLLENKLKGEENAEEITSGLEELENLLWEVELKAGIVPELPEHEKEEPEHKEVVEEIEEKEEVEKEASKVNKHVCPKCDMDWECTDPKCKREKDLCAKCSESSKKEAAYDEKWLEKIDCADCRAVSSGHDRRHYCEKHQPKEASKKEADQVTDETITTNDPKAVIPDPNAPAAPTIQNVQPTDQDNLEVPVVKPTSPPAPGQIWVYNPDVKAYVSMPDPAAPGKTI